MYTLGIAHLPTKTTLSCIVLVVCASDAQCAGLTFSEFYSKGFDWWQLTLAAVLAISAGAAIYFSGGTATPLVAKVGTWIGGLWGLHGAAATSFGLALLGGGSLASGGLGMAGGISVLTAAVSFTPKAATIAYSYAYDVYDRQQFVSRSIRMLALPLPRVEAGPALHREAISVVQRHYNSAPDSYAADKVESTFAQNRKLVAAALALSESSDLSTSSPDQSAKAHIGRALMQLHNGDHAGARQSAEHAFVQFGLRASEIFKTELAVPGLSLPAAVWAISSLSEETVNIQETLVALNYALSFEPDKRFAPVIVACYLDRLILRDDLLQSDHIRRIIDSIRRHVVDDKARAAAMLIVIYRSFVLLKLNQDFITTIAKSQTGTKERTKSRVDRAMRTYTHLIKLIEETLTAVRANDSFFMASEENRLHTGDLGKQLYEYREYQSTLAREVALFGEG